MQPFRDVPAELSDPAPGLVWLNIGDMEPTWAGQKLANAALANALTCKTEFTANEWSAFGIKELRVGHFVQSSTGSYFKPAPGIKWEMGSWSKHEDLRIDPSESVKGFAFTVTVEMEVQICMDARHVASVINDKGPRQSFMLKFESAVSEAKRIKQVQHRFFRRNGANLLLVGFSVTLGSNSGMGGLLFDFGALLTHERLAASLTSCHLIASDDQLCIVKEPMLETMIDCGSAQMKDASLVVSSAFRQVQVTAPWQLSNMLPKPARFKVFARDDPGTLISTEILLEPGQKLMRFSHLTAKAGVFVQLEMDGYTSPRHHLFRKARHEELPLLHASGAIISCRIDTGIAGNSAEFVVTFYMKMVVINRTGLNLAFGYCRPAAPKDGKTIGTRERVQVVPRVQAQTNLLTKEKAMLRRGEDLVLTNSPPEALPWNQARNLKSTPCHHFI
jgi:hypothetical protein